MLLAENLNRHGVTVYEHSGNEKFLVRVCCGDGVCVHGQLLSDLSISLDSRFSGRLAAGSFGLRSGEYAVNEQVSKFVAFVEGSLECVENIDHRFVFVDLRVLSKMGASLWAEIGHVQLS